MMRPFEQAVEAHRQGRLEDALRLYKTLLVKNPAHADAWTNLASVYTRLKRYPDALACYKNLFDTVGESAEALFNHANLQRRMGNTAQAKDSLVRSLQLKPDLHPARINLLKLLTDAGDSTAIEHICLEGLAQPSIALSDEITLINNLVRLYRSTGQADATHQMLTHACSRYPREPSLLRLLGDFHYQQGEPQKALAIYLTIRSIVPQQANIHNALGVVYQAIGEKTLAEQAWRDCITQDPRHAEAHANLGTFYRLARRHDEALFHARTAVRIKPDDAENVAALAYTLMGLGNISEAAELLDAALKAHPDHYDLLCMQGFALVQQARIEEAQDWFRRAHMRAPGKLLAYANRLFSSLYADHLDGAALRRLHEDLAAAVSRCVAPDPASSMPVQAHQSDMANRPLRIGYLSPDLRSHPIGFFIEPILLHHCPDRVQVTCYALPCHADATTERLKRLAHRWRDLDRLSAAQMAAQIRADGIDILVDLAGFTAGGRPDLVAMKAAPIQAHFLGYPSTSGMKAVDYIIADSYLAPPVLEHLYSEKIARLADSFLCYRPQSSTPPVASLPALANGYITFGSYNNLPKLSSTCIALWSSVLRANPGSRLVLMAQGLSDNGVADSIRARFESEGIAGERLTLLPPVVPLTVFLAEYARMDIALDPIPYNGGTTTCDALWMGVPVVALAGQTFFGRMAFSVLNTIGHPEWIADSHAVYIEIATKLAANVSTLKTVRARLRNDVAGSALSDARRYTASLESLYQNMSTTHNARLACQSQRI